MTHLAFQKAMADLTVATKNGAVRGKHVTAGNGSDVRAFLGIPFAKAGRWQKPAPADEWEGVRDATAFGAPPVKPPEVIAFIPIFKQSGLDHHEECLFLNIWSPPVSQIPPQGLPVMAWIYGGALASGETSMPLYEGQNLVAKAAELGTPVILVSIQYRINVFGFLASKEFQEWNEDGSAGNLGFYDQRLVFSCSRSDITG